MSKHPHQDFGAAMEMDELNLDDLFLGGDGDGPMGGLSASMMEGIGGGGGLGSSIAASLFADMDLDLECLMDGIMGMQENASTSSVDDVTGGATGMDNLGSDSMRGMMLLDDEFMGGDFDFDDESSNAVAGGKSTHRRSSINRIDFAGREGDGGVGEAATASLNRKGKRTRTARSNPHHAAAAKPRLQQSKEVASLATSSPSSASTTSVKSRRGDITISSTKSHPSRKKEAQIVHRRDINQLQQQLQQRQKQHGELEPLASTSKFNKHSFDKQLPQSQASGVPMLDGEQELRVLKVRKIEKSLSKFGLATSRTLFYPYMKLPTAALDCKIQRGQKSLYPMLEKFSALLVPSSRGGEEGPTDGIAIPTPTSVTRSTSIKSMSSTQSSTNTTPTTDQCKSVINLSSPIYSLFQHTPAPSPSELIEMLTNSTCAVESTLRHLKKKRMSNHEQSSTVYDSASSLPTPSSSSSSSSPQLIDELVKIYLVHLKQSAFLRQNAINMENWCKDHFTNEDVRSVFPVGRKSMEQVFNLLWMHDKERAIIPVQSQQSQLELGGRDGRKGSGTYPKPPIMISLQVKVKLSGWRDKSGTKLKANLACPRRWKVASERGVIAAATPLPPVDLSSFNTKTLDRVAEEILRFDLLPLKKISSVSVTNSSSKTIAIVSNDTMLEIKEDNKDSLLESDSGKMVDIIDGKSKRRRKSKKVDAVYTSPRLRGATSSDAVQLSSSRGSSKNAFIPHIPGFNNPLFLSRNLPREAYDEIKSGTIHEEGQRIVHALYNSIMQPAVKPSKRRTLLAEEVSLSLSRLNKHKHPQLTSVSQLPQPLSSSFPYKIRDQTPNQSQAAQLEDVELMPTTYDIAGMWKYLEKCNYFEVFEKEEDLILGLECLWQPETVEVDYVVNEDGGYYFWGSLPQKLLATPMKNNIAETTEGEDEAKEAIETNSPLYDHLQSLLVEVEDAEGADNNITDNDDDYIIATLPSYSPEEFINGPKTGNDSKGAESANISVSDNDTDEYEGDASALFDQSTLTLDQRTYIHLCAARLVDRKLPPSHHNIPPTLPSSSFPSSNTTTIIEATENSNDEHIDAIVQKIKARLSTLRDDTNATITELHHMVLSQGLT